jgi:hypothetical protein
MSANRSVPLEIFEQALLRWSDAPNSGSHEEFVEVLRSHISEIVIRCTLKVADDTEVYLIGKHYKGHGRVRSSRKEGKSFILRIVIDENLVLRCGSDLDPGVLAVEDFLTEAQEEEILKDVEKETQRSGFHRGPTLATSDSKRQTRS